MRIGNLTWTSGPVDQWTRGLRVGEYLHNPRRGKSPRRNAGDVGRIGSRGNSLFGNGIHLAVRYQVREIVIWLLIFRLDLVPTINVQVADR